MLSSSSNKNEAFAGTCDCTPLGGESKYFIKKRTHKYFQPHAAEVSVPPDDWKTFSITLIQVFAPLGLLSSLLALAVIKKIEVIIPTLVFRSFL